MLFTSQKDKARVRVNPLRSFSWKVETPFLDYMPGTSLVARLFSLNIELCGKCLTNDFSVVKVNSFVGQNLIGFVPFSGN